MIQPCPGDGYQEDDGWEWREGCEDCQRRLAGDPSLPPIDPPSIIVFECEYRLTQADV